MRIFIAIPISKKLQKEIEKYREFYSDLPARWLEGKNLHITLIPPWEEDNIDEVKDILKTIESKIGSFEMNFEKVSFGTNSYSPRLIWAIGKTPKQIIELKKLLENALNMPSERNDFLLHLTLARFRPEDFKNFPVKKIDDKINWREIVEEFIIMRSHLSRNGAEYEILERFRL
ncbi:MAG: RNA 2',3'-cyclic phosphodiesterase [Patescibacteria group bacterium]|nr:RNA 2',3'-cyclic phosphodiesterase [Patescibacteria group bacterium]